MYEAFHQEEQQKFDFSYDRILQSGMTTKDFIAPTSFLFKSGKDFMMGDTYGAASYLNILAPELTDKVLAEFLDMDKNLVVSIHVQSVDQLKAIKLIKGKITDLDRMKIEEQKKAVRSGYDMEIIPSDLATYGGEAKKILDDLQSRNERMFLVTVLFLNTAKTKQELDSAVFQTAGIAQKFNCTLNRLDYLQEQGLMSSLPLANNLVPIKRALTTTSTAIFVPFTTQELFMEGDSLYYGLNAVSNNMIMADRKQLKNPNGLILGTPGSGKSFSAKREITNVFFTTTDDIIVADPEGEYYPLVEALGGQVIHISSTSKDYINPMDINLNYADDDNPLGMKSDFILSLCELIMGARDGMEPEEKSVIDRCLPLVYQKYLNDPKPENMPTLGDLYDCLREQKERQAQRIATALEIYVNGSLRVFNHQTNVELDNRIICFDIKELGKQLKKIGIDHCSGSGLEPCHHQPQQQKEHPVLYRRVPPPAERGTDRSIQRRDLEAVQKMGRCTDRNYAEHQGFAGQPRNRKHLREQRFYLYAQSGIRRSANPCKAAEYLAVPAVVCDEQQRGRGAAVLRQHDNPIQG